MADPEAMTTTGRVRGSVSDGGVVFRGIPYAAPPVGDLRFRRPTRHASWDGVRPCHTFGAACPQARSGGTGGVMGVFDSGEPMGEDCLTLNVWTPAVDGSRRPVMVWIHGGGFRSGDSSCPVYGGGAFIRDDVVLVTINYRLHAFGFLYLDGLFDEVDATGNLGILDQLAALEWVHDNVGSFGGDPDNVTLFGESAGAMSVVTLLTLPEAQGLVRRAIAQSGAGHHTLSVDAADRVARRVLGLLEVRAGDWPAMLGVPAGAIVKASARVGLDAARLLSGEFSAAMPFQPVVDGVTLRATPVRAIAAGAAGGVDLVAGTCADELRIVAWGMPEQVQRHHLDPAVATVLSGAGRSLADVDRMYASEADGALATELDRALAMETDYRYSVPAAFLAEEQSHHARAWLYRFTWPTPVLNGVLGTCHALDVPFVFGTPSRAPLLVGDDPPDELIAALHGAWIRFARTGDPGGGSLPDWPSYDTTRRPVMEIDRVSRVVDDPARARRVLWRDLVEAWIIA